MLLHTADWHLGKILDGISLFEEQQDIFSRFCDEAKKLSPELILICGDLFDFAGKTDAAKGLFDTVMRRLTTECNCPIVITTGNHDDIPFTQSCIEPYLDRGVTFVHQTECTPMHFTVDGQSVYLYPFSYLSGEQMNALGASSVQQAYEMRLAATPRVLSMDGFHVAMAHGLILPQGNEAVDKLLAANKDNGSTLVDSALFSMFDYTALGHIHANLFAEYRCYYPGSPLIYDKKEIGQPKGYNTVSFSHGRASVQRHALYPKHPTVRLTGEFDAIEQNPPAYAKNAYLYLELWDTVPKKDGLERMQRIFPHLVNLRYRLDTPKRNDRRIDGMAERFALFLSHCGQTITDDELAILKQLE